MKPRRHKADCAVYGHISKECDCGHIGECTPPAPPTRPRWSLLPARATARVVELLTWAASTKHQDEQGREKSLDEQYDSLMRHLEAWRLGERFDAESKKEALAHVAARALFMLEIELKKETK